MTVSELRYLMAVARMGGDCGRTSGSEVARCMNVSRVSVFRALGRLERAGLALKGEDKCVRLTEAGLRVLEEYSALSRMLKAHLMRAGLAEDAAESESLKMACAMGEEARRAVFASFGARGKN